MWRRDAYGGAAGVEPLGDPRAHNSLDGPRKHRLSDLIQQKRTKIEAEQRDRARTARSGWRHLRRNVKRIAKTHEEGRAMNRFGLRPPARPSAIALHAF